MLCTGGVTITTDKGDVYGGHAHGHHCCRRLSRGLCGPHLWKRTPTSIRMRPGRASTPWTREGRWMVDALIVRGLPGTALRGPPGNLADPASGLLAVENFCKLHRRGGAHISDRTCRADPPDTRVPLPVSLPPTSRPIRSPSLWSSPSAAAAIPRLCGPHL